MDFINSIGILICYSLACCMFYKCLTPKKSAKIFSLILPVLVSVIFPLIMYSPLITRIFPDLIFKRQLMMAVIYISYFVYTLCCFKDKTNDKIAMYGVFILVSFLHELLVTLCFVCSSKPLETFTIPSVKIKIIMTAITVAIAFVLYMSLIILRKKINRVPPWQMTISAIFMLMSAIFISMLVLNSHPSVYTPKNYISNIVMGFLFFLALIAAMYFLFRFVSDQIRLKEKAECMQSIQKNSIEHYKSVQENIKEVRKLKHDFKDNLTVLKLLIDSNDPENISKASSLISKINNDLDKINIAHYTENEVINAVLSAKINEAKNSSIKVAAKLDVPKFVGTIDDYDLNVLVINLMNNAIDACKKISAKERLIEISIVVKANLFIVKISNPYKSLNYDPSGKLRTTKAQAQEHGIGLELIKQIADKYEGDDDIKIENGKFIHYVSLDMKA